MLARIAVIVCLTLVMAAVSGCGGDERGQRASGADGAGTSVAERQRTSDSAKAGAAQSGAVRLQPVGRFANPTAIAAPPEDHERLFVTEQGGRIRVMRRDRVLARPFLDLSREVVAGGEQGLLGLAFAPDYATSGRFYVNYTNRSGDTRLVEYRRSAASADVADPRSARVLLRQDQPEANHNGGQLAFGPDGLLYMGLGDGGGGNDRHGRRGNAQNLSTILGKIIRIDPRRSGRRPYGIPRDNPFAGRSGARGEIYSYGLRNPWRFSFDRETGNLAIADVGQSEIEEIDYASRRRARGGNFGWRPFEGTRRLYAGERVRDHIAPVLQLDHDDGYCSITGGYVVRDPTVPALVGRYVYGDFCDGNVRSAILRSGGARDDRRLDVRKVGSISTFGEDAQARVYVASLDGSVYRFVQG